MITIEESHRDGDELTEYHEICGIAGVLAWDWILTPQKTHTIVIEAFLKRL